MMMMPDYRLGIKTFYFDWRGYGILMKYDDRPGIDTSYIDRRGQKELMEL